MTLEVRKAMPGKISSGILRGNVELADSKTWLSFVLKKAKEKITLGVG